MAAKRLPIFLLVAYACLMGAIIGAGTGLGGLALVLDDLDAATTELDLAVKDLEQALKARGDALQESRDLLNNL